VPRSSDVWRSFLCQHPVDRGATDSERLGDLGWPAADPTGSGTRLYGGATLAPPALIIQDELHLISGPLGTVAALYKVALDRLATRVLGEKQVRPKIVASTATVRRAGQQIKALFDRHRTEVFRKPGLSRSNSFFALTVPPSHKPARLYVGMAAPGKGPKLIFLRALTTLLAAAEKQAPDGGDADASLTALCYFNALRELGGARRIVEDEVRAKLATYGSDRRRRNCKVRWALRRPPSGSAWFQPRCNGCAETTSCIVKSRTGR
jgi:hypothetical protein